MKCELSFARIGCGVRSHGKVFALTSTFFMRVSAPLPAAWERRGSGMKMDAQPASMPQTSSTTSQSGVAHAAAATTRSVLRWATSSPGGRHGRSSPRRYKYPPRHCLWPKLYAEQEAATRTLLDSHRTTWTMRGHVFECVGGVGTELAVRATHGSAW